MNLNHFELILIDIECSFASTRPRNVDLFEKGKWAGVDGI